MPRPMPTPQEIADRYAAGMAQAAERYKRGIARVTENPAAKAAQKLDKAKANYINAIDSGKTARGLNRVTLQGWAQMASTKGANNLTTGAAAAKPKVVAYQQATAAAQQQLRNEIDSMPNNTQAEREARALAWMRGMSQIASNRQ